MKPNDFFERYDESSEKQVLKKILVSFSLILGIFIVLQIIISLPPDVQKVNTHGILIDGKKHAHYHNITNTQRKKYEIPWDYVPCEDDLGEQIGIVWNWNLLSYKGLNGCKVYSYSKHPDKRTICIVETPSGYYFFTCEWLEINVKVGRKSDIWLSAVELPDSLEKMEVIALTTDLSESTDKNQHGNITDVGKSILEVLSGKRNIGIEERSRRYAQLWYDTYGNDNLYFDEKEGIIRIQDKILSPTNYSEERNAIWDKGRELWNKGCKKIKITTKQGFELSIYYHPAVHIFKYENGYYDLSVDDVEKLNHLLQIPY